MRAVAAAGHEVGSHTLTHVRLAGADPADGGPGGRREPAGPGGRPAGRGARASATRGANFDAAAADAVRAAGYDHACVTGDYLPGDRFTVPRSYVAPGDTALHLVAKLARHHWRMRGTPSLPGR